MTKSSLLVTGASGHLGARVVELLLERGEKAIIATTRTPDALARFSSRGVDVRRADFDDEAGLASAFAGAERALLVSTDSVLEPGKRIRQHQGAVRALGAAGVRHVVYTSLPDADRSSAAVAPDHAATEAALRASPLEHTILRNNIYLDLLLYSLGNTVASGKLIDARDSGRLAYVTREDCARVAAAALADRSLVGRQTHDVTGPAAVTSAEVAAILSDLARKPVTHVSVPLEALIAGMVEHGLPRPLAELYASFDASVARGELSAVSDTVQRFTGTAPQSAREFLNANRASFT